MPPEQLFDEAQVRSLLGGSEEEVRQGLALVDQHLRRHLRRWLRRQFPGLSSEDLADAWGETLLGVLRAARQRRFRPDQPLLPWLCHIARARAIDATRRQTAWRELRAALGRLHQDASLHASKQASVRAKTEEILAAVRDFIATLPEKQRMVLQIYVAHHPQTRSMSVLQQAVCRQAGRPHSLAVVKRALQEARRKLREHLRGLGLDLEGAIPP